jgi:serine/threonine protein kinase
MDTLKAGDVIGSYRVIRLLGSGGMGAVYEVAHLSGGKSKALKIFTSIGSHADFLRKRFIAEGKILKRLNHPNLVKVHDLALDDSTGAPYFTMDVVLGSDGKPCTLEDLRRRGVLDEQAVTALYSDLRSALQYLHGEGVVHRDIKLENVLVNSEGHAVLSDFGVSRIVKPDLRRYLAVTTTFAEDRAPIMGSAGYLSPELKSGAAATPSDDAWALGILIFRLLTGVWYEEGSSAMELLAGFDPKWTTLLNVLLNTEPKKRLPLPAVSAHTSRRRNNLKRAVWAVAAIAVFVAAAEIVIACFSKPHYDFDEFFPPEIEETAS